MRMSSFNVFFIFKQITKTFSTFKYKKLLCELLHYML